MIMLGEYTLNLSNMQVQVLSSCVIGNTWIVYLFVTDVWFISGLWPYTTIGSYSIPNDVIDVIS